MSNHHSKLHWCYRKHCLSTKLSNQTKSWLFDSGSLTERLMSHCDGDFSVKILSVKRAVPAADEISVLGLKPRSLALIRQVLLCCNDVPVVYARTIIPVSSLRGELRGLAMLGNKPLGAVLFSDKTMKRKPMQVTSLLPKDRHYKWTLYNGPERIWGRRSVFVLKNRELLVSEFFLPNLYF